jgi:hypothetical protein
VVARELLLLGMILSVSATVRRRKEGIVIVDGLAKTKWVVPKSMRYETFGDYDDEGKIELYEGMTDLQRLATGVHELIERVLLHLQGVTAEMVDEWDFGGTGGESDPNMYNKDPRYKAAHRYAQAVERRIVTTAGLSWEEYNKALDDLDIRWRRRS